MKVYEELEHQARLQRTLAGTVGRWEKHARRRMNMYRTAEEKTREIWHVENYNMLVAELNTRADEIAELRARVELLEKGEQENES